MIRCFVLSLIALIMLVGLPKVGPAQSCPGEYIDCNRCGASTCFTLPVISYGNITSVNCFYLTNSCGGFCYNPQEIYASWEATCQGQTYYGGGTLCCSY